MTGDSDGAATVDRAKRDLHDVAAQRRKAATIADPKAREFLRKADPILARLMDARPDFHPRAWMDELPPLDAFGTLVFQVTGQQLSVSATRTILSRLQERFGGRLPSPAELLAADPEVLRASGLSARKGATLRALAERFVNGRLSDQALARMTDDEVEAVLTEVPGIGPWTAPISAGGHRASSSPTSFSVRASLRLRTPSAPRSWPQTRTRPGASA
jgi:3-methyladenine DNA glycosylase/8-oxoguanine DNA glycosylase